ncbi:hypothetical protein ACWEO2_17640 [Nocardia sp. NPDC004278]
MDGVHLSTRLLLECASVFDELYLMSLGSIWRSAGFPDKLGTDLVGHLKMLRLTLEGEYGFPDRFAEIVIGRPVDPALLLAMIDFALNPPVPGLTAGVKSVGFDELYPPMRFMRAAQALAMELHELERSHPTSELVTDLHRRLVSMTGLRLGTVDVQLSTGRTPREVVRNSTVGIDIISNMVFSCADRLIKERREKPHRLSHFALNFFELDGIRIATPGIDGAWWFKPVLRVGNDEYLWPVEFVDKDEATDLLISIASSSAFDDALASIGPLSSQHLPLSALRDASERDALSNIVRKLTRLDVRWEIG